MAVAAANLVYNQDDSQYRSCELGDGYLARWEQGEHDANEPHAHSVRLERNGRLLALLQRYNGSWWVRAAAEVGGALRVAARENATVLGASSMRHALLEATQVLVEQRVEPVVEPRFARSASASV